MNTSTIVQKLWNYCNVLCDDGISYDTGDFLLMAHDYVVKHNLHLTKTYSERAKHKEVIG